MRTKRTIPVIVIAAGLVLAACGDDDTTAAPATSAPAPAPNSSTPDATATPTPGGPAEAATVSIATSADLGDHLVGPEGFTLYLFTKDQGTTTACDGGCADNWPPLVAAAAPTAGDGVDPGELSTANGIVPDHVAYHGHLLYYFAGDRSPGDTNRVGIPSWYAVDPSGQAIGADDTVTTVYVEEDY
jgi:predicted lipoprotein with Yx(FWY)xxD motif